MLNDKVAFVTGARSGIGRAIALAYGRACAKVVVAEATATLVRNEGHDRTRRRS